MNVYLLIFLIFANTMKDKKKISVFISSGIGDSVLLVPLLKLLRKKDENYICIILNSHFVDKDFFIFNNFPFDELILLTDINKNLISFLKYFKNFDEIYLDYSNSSVKNLLLTSYLSKKVYAYRKNKIPLPGIIYITPQINVHASVLNAKMIDDSVNEENFSLDLMLLKPQNENHRIIKKIKDSGSKIIVAQISSGNNKAKYKDWPIEYWINFYEKLLLNYPSFTIILLGDKNEIYLGEKVLSELNSERVISFIGNTTLKEASNILYNSDMYIGLDSGFMHLAISYNLPTFILLGASSEEFIGYQKFNSTKHYVVFENLYCRSCNAWISSNTIKVSRPGDCKDIKCMKNLKPQSVFRLFQKYIENLKI